jgi:hypothetical protein
VGINDIDARSLPSSTHYTCRERLSCIQVVSLSLVRRSTEIQRTSPKVRRTRAWWNAYPSSPIQLFRHATLNCLLSITGLTTRWASQSTCTILSLMLLALRVTYFHHHTYIENSQSRWLV